MRPVDVALLDLQERRVVRRRLHVLEAGDLRRALEPVLRVLVEDVVLRREAADPRERAGADGVRVRERRGIRDPVQMCFGTTNCAFSTAGMNCESTVFSLIATLYGPDALIETMFVSGCVSPIMSIALSCLSGRQAVDDVGGRERLAVRPLDAVLQVEREGLVPVRPLPALGEPRIHVTAAGDRADDQRLVEGAAHEAAARQARRGVRVEVADEGGIARARHDEARVPGEVGRAGCGGARRRGARHERSGGGEARERKPYAPAGKRTSGRIVQSFLARGRIEAETA